MNEAVRSEQRGPVTTVILSRPEVRNAVDRPTAEALAAAFREFEQDDEARVAVLWGDSGTFCAGADLKALADGRGNRIAPDGDGPMGPSRMLLSKPVIAAIAATRSPAGSSWRCGATCGSPSRTPCSGCSAAAGACR
jgi:enoyl-CoA hydratase